MEQGEPKDTTMAQVTGQVLEEAGGLTTKQEAAFDAMEQNERNKLTPQQEAEWDAMEQGEPKKEKMAQLGDGPLVELQQMQQDGDDMVMPEAEGGIKLAEKLVAAQQRYISQQEGMIQQQNHYLKKL